MAVNFGSKTQGALGFPYNTGPSLAAGSALPPLPGNTQHQHTPAAARCVLRTSVGAIQIKYFATQIALLSSN